MTTKQKIKEWVKNADMNESIIQYIADFAEEELKMKWRDVYEWGSANDLNDIETKKQLEVILREISEIEHKGMLLLQYPLRDFKNYSFSI